MTIATYNGKPMIEQSTRSRIADLSYLNLKSQKERWQIDGYTLFVWDLCWFTRLSSSLLIWTGSVGIRIIHNFILDNMKLICSATHLYSSLQMACWSWSIFFSSLTLNDFVAMNEGGLWPHQGRPLGLLLWGPSCHIRSSPQRPTFKLTFSIKIGFGPGRDDFPGPC